MKYFTPKNTDLNISRIAQGCMRIAGLGDKDLDAMIGADLDAGINFFDHADIYSKGRCEEKFGAYLKRNPSARDKMIIQTKCGIVIGKRYDFTEKHITECVEGSLKRLGVERIDVLLLHRPDALCEPETVAEIFDRLYRDGKVRYFGVSNHNSFQIELLQRYMKQKLVFNQLQFSPVHTGMINSGIHVNMKDSAAVMRDGMTLDYCRLNGITIQPWSPFRAKAGSYLGNIFYGKLNRELKKLCVKYGITDSAAVLAWILRHPACMQPIIGSTDPARIAGMAKAAETTITHEEWYDVYRAAGNRIP